MKELDRLMIEILLIKKSLLAMENNGLVLGGWLTKILYYAILIIVTTNLETSKELIQSRFQRLVAGNFIRWTQF